MRVAEAPLRAAVTALIETTGVPPDDAALAADVLLSADLRGVDSHGVSNMLKTYLDRYADGIQNPRPEWRIVRERAATANIDGDRGLGVIIAAKAMDIAIAKAREAGVGVVTVTNAGHLGMAAYHAMLALPPRHGGRLHDGDWAAGRADVRPRAEAGHEPHRGRGAGRQRAGVRLRLGHERRAHQQDTERAAHGRDAAARPRC